MNQVQKVQMLLYVQKATQAQLHLHIFVTQGICLTKTSHLKHKKIPNFAAVAIEAVSE